MMTLQQIRQVCEDNGGEGHVFFVMPMKPRNGQTMRLAHTSGPTGRAMYVDQDGHTVARFGAKAVLRWLDQQESKPS